MLLSQPKKQLIDFLGSKFFSFSVIGVVGFVVDTATLYGVVHGFGLDLYSARLISYLFAVTTTWILNRLFTFKKFYDPRLFRQWLRFLTVNSLGGVISYTVYAVGISMVDVIAEYPVLGVALGSIAGLIANYTCSSLFVFRAKPSIRPLVERISPLLGVTTPFILFVMLFSLGFNDASLANPEADSLMMKGVVIADFIQNQLLDKPLDYALAYFAQYPVLNLNSQPAFFSFFVSLFIIPFGVKIWVGHLALMIMAFCGGVSFFRLLTLIYSRSIAVMATSLLVSTPLVVSLSWYTLAEIPALSMLLVSAFFVWRFAAGDGNRFIYFAALSLAIALWTKVDAVFAVFWFFPFLLISAEVAANL